MLKRIMLAVLGVASLSPAQNFFPLKDVRPGMHGVGRTVFQGERIEEFQVEILGVLQNLGPRQSIVLARLSGGPLAQTGVLQGMSGSPVYIDGKLLGAVALGFPFSKEPIAGIQPIESMIADATLGGPTLQSGLPNSPGFVANNLSNLPIPLSFSGFSDSAVQLSAGPLSKLGFNALQGVAPQHREPAPTSAAGRQIAPGSMISVGLITGDMNMTADGTVTYIDGKRIYAFGHRFLNTGSVELPFAHSEVIASIPTLNSSFKLSAPMEWVGTILSDRDTAVAGEIGRTARTVPLTIAVNSSTTGHHAYHMQVVNDRLLTPFLSQAALSSAIDATERSVGAATLRVKGRADFEDGLPPLEMRDVFVSDTALSQLASANAVTLLGFVLGGGYSKLHLKSISFTIDQLESKRQLRLVQAWASAHDARPGDVVTLSALLEGDSGFQITRNVDFRIPRGTPQGVLNFTVGDASSQNFPEFGGTTQSSLESARRLIEAVNAYRSSDTIYIRVWRPEPSFSVGGPMPGGELPDPPPSVMLILADPSASASATASNPSIRGSEVDQLTIPVTGYAVSGAKSVQVEIKE